MTNYFKVDGHFIFFNGAKIEDTQKAFDKALALASNHIPYVNLYALPTAPGPWDRCGLVGHRTRAAILSDLNNQDDPVEASILREELARLNTVYSAAGRTAPLAEVA